MLLCNGICVVMEVRVEITFQLYVTEITVKWNGMEVIKEVIL